MICKNYKEYYQSSIKIGFGNYRPYSGSTNFGRDRSFVISSLIAIVIFALIYFLNSGNL
jgi:hypothetical protein